MEAGYVIVFVIYAMVALFMLGIGIVQLKSKKPVGFYSGEEPPKAEDITDVGAWNRRHGMMWLIYGILILLSYMAGYIIGDSVWSIVPMVGGLIVPLIFMVWYHHRLKKEYLK